ncbi:MAG TPA: hypothetical protein VNC17_14030 [Thermoleophilaceae bacterium]|nr:hypothetical protein [Thermoleophilaceae bacterium]
MKRWILPGLLVAAFALAATGLADPGHGKNTKKKFGPYDVVTDDNGSCGVTAWAVDTEKRTFKVKRNSDGSYRVTRTDRGTFVTTAGQSPGACETKGKHGATVLGDIKGKFHGYLRGNITGGTFNPNAPCLAAPTDCGFTDVWIATFFGPSATFSCNTDSAKCAFNFQYHARHQGLKFHHWYDLGKGAGTFLKERFHGDIANA